MNEPNHIEVAETDELLSFLLRRFPQEGRKRLKNLLRVGRILVNGQSQHQFDFPLAVGQNVAIAPQKATIARPGAPPMPIIHEDEFLIVVNKPSGLLTVATDKEKRRTAYAMLSEYVKAAHPDHKIFVVHRIDRETSGLLLFAKSEEVKRAIQDSWLSVIEERLYMAVLEGKLAQASGTIKSYLKESAAMRVYSSDNPHHGKEAISHFRRLAVSRAYTLVELRLETGRKHQIRVHMAELGHPVAGDKKYGATTNPLKRMALHARVLAFHHPVDGHLHHYETPVPPTFAAMFSAASGNIKR
ncbi:MAG: RluA family pseudouridine synthase [Desulfobulbaceae bacterium]|jgi:23S rRNA pseudouridine1911/1915/1917 synthase|nr:RluA family pseudouridine synthase [Desulfobulbaceae bacterium]